MTTMLFYDRTVARFLPLLCSNLNLLYGGVPVRRAGAPNSMQTTAQDAESCLTTTRLSPGIDKIMADSLDTFSPNSLQALPNPPARICRVNDGVDFQVGGHIDGFPSLVCQGN